MSRMAFFVFTSLVLDRFLGRPSTNLLRERRPWFRALLSPGFYKPLPADRRRRIRTKVEAAGANLVGEALFLYVRYSPEIREDEKLMAKLDSFLNKYGFARNLAFTTVCLGIALLLNARAHPDPTIHKYAAVALIAGILPFYRYLKFFRQYTYELFNTYAGKLS